MNRRDFMQRASVGALALSLPDVSGFWKSKGTSMGIVVHSYASRWNSKSESKKYPAFTDALALLEHCHQIGAGGAQVVVANWTADFAKKVRDRREKLNLYLEGSIGVPKNAADVARFETEVKNAREAGAQVLRTVVSKGRRYEDYPTLQSFLDLKKTAQTSLQLAEPVLRKYKVKLAVENHKDWQAKELAALLKQISSEWIGATIDFGNNMSLLETPLEVVQTLAPYAFSTHVKDMAVEEYEDGFLLSEVPLGKGVCDLANMVAVCKEHHPEVTFNLEMITRDPLKIPCLKENYWATFPEVNGSQLAEMLRLVKSQKAVLPRVSNLGAEGILEAEEKNILACLNYSKNNLKLS